MGYAYRLSGNLTDSEDAVQEAFFRLWKNRSKVREEGVKSWLYTCVYRIIIDNFRKNKRIEVGGELPDNPMDDQNFEEIYSDPVQIALDSLSRVQKSIVLLRDIEEYAYEEIAEMMDLSLSQVKVYLFRARKKLHSKLRDLNPQKGKTVYGNKIGG